MADSNCSGQTVSQSFLQKLAESGQGVKKESHKEGFIQNTGSLIDIVDGAKDVASKYFHVLLMKLVVV